MFESVAGLAMYPYRGARDEGVMGLAKGVGKATIGAAVKPYGGIYYSAQISAHFVAD